MMEFFSIQAYTLELCSNRAGLTLCKTGDETQLWNFPSLVDSAQCDKVGYVIYELVHPC